MPTYEYKCEECGIRFDRFQHFSDAPVEDCPECDGHVHRVIHPVGIVFKGKGFYVTDNRANNSAGTPKTDGEPKTETAEKATGETPKSDAVKTEPKASTAKKADTD